ncbi:hypothetical protein KC19_VG021900 [Ceratodon purpureus]|uniref:Uncharacterized protein n=1 Tax=Ceratodon purpureus TaxID=3225 RepID=A0A8T0HLK3_CERPU|nr:hypothetical protein KC19_VG021900 [Ceratodon purpureus]
MCAVPPSKLTRLSHALHLNHLCILPASLWSEIGEFALVASGILQPLLRRSILRTRFPLYLLFAAEVTVSRGWSLSQTVLPLLILPQLHSSSSYHFLPQRLRQRGCA